MPKKLYKKEFFSIGEAATMTGLSVYTLRRLEGKGLVKFKRINGRRYISEKELREAPILSLGKAAFLIGSSYYKLKNLAKEDKISVRKSPIIRISYNELKKIKKNIGNLPSLLA